MGKKIVIVCFAIASALAVYVFATRENQSLRETISNTGTKEARMVLEDFVVFRYEGDIQTGRIMARSGQFFEPNIVELDGDVHGEQITKDGLETMNAESATGYYNATSLTSVMEQKTQLSRAELSGFVEVGVADHVLVTDYAQYIHREHDVKSTRPVRVEGPNRVFTGDEGFTYDLKSQTLKMTGPVKGVVAIEKNR